MACGYDVGLVSFLSILVLIPLVDGLFACWFRRSFPHAGRLSYALVLLSHFALYGFFLATYAGRLGTYMPGFVTFVASAVILAASAIGIGSATAAVIGAGRVVWRRVLSGSGKFHLVLHAVLTLLVAAVWGPRPPVMYEEIYRYGFECSCFTPRGSASEWWVSGEMADSLAENMANLSRGEALFWVRWRGSRTGLGSFGHLGASPYEIFVSEIAEMEPL